MPAASPPAPRPRAPRSELERARGEAARLRAELEQARHALDQRARAELLGRLSSSLGHDFNNLFGVISNSAHLLQRRTDDPASQTALAAIFRSVDSATRLTRQLLQFANGHDGESAASDLENQLAGMHELMRLTLGKRISLSLQVAAGTRAPRVDASGLELALLSLLLNARVAMPDGGRVWIEAGNADASDGEFLPAGDLVAVCVSDDGCGMDEATLARAFDPFFTTGRDAEACGLGLSHVRQFCRAAGGEAKIASTPGLGTAVTLLLPSHREPAPGHPHRADAGADVRKPTPSPTPVQAAASAPAPGARLLLVEDIRELGDLTAALLENYGYSVLRADHAEQALQVLADGAACDIVLTDIRMPGALDGVDLARALRERAPGLPVVLISGYFTATARAQGFPLLRKPCSPELLVETLERALAATGRRRRAGE